MRNRLVARASTLLITSLLVCSVAYAADIEWQRDDDNLAGIRLAGEILPGDDERFRQLMLELVSDHLVPAYIFIYSPGGSVPAAISIGRQIRALRMQTIAPQKQSERGTDVIMCSPLVSDHEGKRLAHSEIQRNHWKNPLRAVRGFNSDNRCTCTSACFLIWAGGVGRNGDWVGVHRPFFDRDKYAKLSPGEAEQEYNNMLEEVRVYLAEIDIPESIIRKMKSANSENMEFLSKVEIKDLYNDDDAALEELAIAKCGGFKKSVEDIKKCAERPRYYKQCSEEWEKRVLAEAACQRSLYVEKRRKAVDAYMQLYGR